MSPDWPIGRNKKSVTQREQTVGSGVGVQHGTHRSTLRGRPRFQAFSNKLRLFSRAPISQAIVTAEDYLRYGDFTPTYGDRLSWPPSENGFPLKHGSRTQRYPSWPDRTETAHLFGHAVSRPSWRRAPVIREDTSRYRFFVCILHSYFHVLAPASAKILRGVTGFNACSDGAMHDSGMARPAYTEPTSLAGISRLAGFANTGCVVAYLRAWQLAPSCGRSPSFRRAIHRNGANNIERRSYSRRFQSVPRLEAKIPRRSCHSQRRFILC